MDNSEKFKTKHFVTSIPAYINQTNTGMDVHLVRTTILASTYMFHGDTEVSENVSNLTCRLHPKCHQGKLGSSN